MHKKLMSDGLGDAFGDSHFVKASRFLTRNTFIFTLCMDYVMWQRFRNETRGQI